MGLVREGEGAKGCSSLRLTSFRVGDGILGYLPPREEEGSEAKSGLRKYVSLSSLLKLRRVFGGISEGL